MICSRHLETQSEQVAQTSAGGCVASTFFFFFPKAPEMGPSNGCMRSVTYSTQSPVTLSENSLSGSGEIFSLTVKHFSD